MAQGLLGPGGVLASSLATDFLGSVRYPSEIRSNFLDTVHPFSLSLNYVHCPFAMLLITRPPSFPSSLSLPRCVQAQHTLFTYKHNTRYSSCIETS